MATAVASNFRTLFEFDYRTGMMSFSPSTESPLSTSPTVGNANHGKELAIGVKLHTETLTIMENFSRASFMFGYSTFPNDDDTRMPISVWSNCAYTIQVIGKP